MNGTFVIKSAMVALSITFFMGCAQCRAQEKEKMMILGASLMHLSTAVEGYVHYKPLPSTITEAELLDLAAKDNPQLLDPFRDYKVRVLSVDKHAIVLICTKDGRQGLLEDAGCTALLDRHLWEAVPNLPCEFTLKASEVCGR